MFVNNRYGKVEIIPEAIGMIGKWIDVRRAIFVKLRFGVKLNKFETECVIGRKLKITAKIC